MHLKKLSTLFRLLPPLALLLLSAVALTARAGAPALGQRDTAPVGVPTASPTPTCPPAWQVLTSPNPSTTVNYLFGVASVAATDVWAVGTYDAPGGVGTSLVEHWDGSQWQVIPSPNPGAEVNLLNGITALAPDDIWAVGHYTSSGPWRTLVEHWDGTTWTVIPSPNAVGDSNTLISVSAYTTNDVWAVGYYDSNGFSHTLVEHWDGTQWSTVPSPHPGTDGEELRAVSVFGSNDVWAVGMYAISQPDYPLIIHWDGSTWSQIPSPNPSGSRHTLFWSLAGAGPQDVWVAGCAFGCSQSLLEHWDGTQWSIVPSPVIGTDLNYLYGIAAPASDNVWAVGYYGDQTQSPPNGTLVLHWDGTSWTHRPSPSPGSFYNEFQAVATVDGAVWTVGTEEDCLGCHFRTLITRYAPLCPPPSLTPSPTATSPTRTTQTPSPSPTQHIAPTGTATPSPTPQPISTPCPLTFSDVPANSPFYPYVRCLVCRGIISGYSASPPCAPGGAPCFNGGATVTRGQIAKIVTNAAGFTDAIPSTQQTFTDVPYGSPFWLYIERAARHSIISGYDSICGLYGYGTPCFLASWPMTRGQLAKVVVSAVGFQDPIPSTQQTFADVPYGSPFWIFVERATLHGVLSGYSTSPPCPAAVPCFLPGNGVTRNQAAKIVANTFFPNCQTPQR